MKILHSYKIHVHVHVHVHVLRVKKKTKHLTLLIINNFLPTDLVVFIL